MAILAESKQLMDLVIPELNDAPPIGDDFWVATPVLADDIVWARVGQGIVMWGGSASFTINQVGSVVVEQLNGSVSLRELAEDLAWAGGIPAATARHVISALVDELAAREVLQRLPTRSKPEHPSATSGLDSSASIDLDDRNGAEAADQTDSTADKDGRKTAVHHSNGEIVTTEYLPNGSRIVSTTIAISTHDTDLDLLDLIGARSPAELVPPDSCLGSKLRLSDPAHLIDVTNLARSMSVRFTDSWIGQELERSIESARIVDSETEERGPVEVFVVSPLEGAGPFRVFDGLGRRRGRPRGRDEVIELVNEILAERLHSMVTTGPDAAVPLSARLLGTPSGEAFLIPKVFTSQRRLVAACRRSGYRVSWTNPELLGATSATAPTLRSGDRRRVNLRGIILGESEDRSHVDHGRIAIELLAGLRWKDPDAQRRALALVAQLLSSVEIYQIPVEDDDAFNHRIALGFEN